MQGSFTPQHAFPLLQDMRIKQRFSLGATSNYFTLFNTKVFPCNLTNKNDVCIPAYGRACLCMCECICCLHFSDVVFLLLI